MDAIYTTQSMKQAKQTAMKHPTKMCTPMTSSVTRMTTQSREKTALASRKKQPTMTKTPLMSSSMKETCHG